MKAFKNFFQRYETYSDNYTFQYLMFLVISGFSGGILFMNIIGAIIGSEHYVDGKATGYVTIFENKGVFFPSHEGVINTTQTGIISTETHLFSIDNNVNDSLLINTLDSAVTKGWKVQLVYHETFGRNWFRNRGSTDTFVDTCIVLSKQ